MAYFWIKTPLGKIIEIPDGKEGDELLSKHYVYWNILADSIIDKKEWKHHSTDDRSGWISYWKPKAYLDGLMRIHVSYALFLYKKITGKDFKEE